jgi:hypothetical protein
MLPALRLTAILVWAPGSWPSPSAVLNLVIRIAVLLVLAVITWRYRETWQEVKVLRGMLPICMHCRRIRDEHQQWQSLESYLSSHSEAKLSHGLCPECARRFYPDIFSAGPGPAP